MWKIVLCVTFAWGFSNARGYTFDYGRCPNVQSEPGFTLNRMLGNWYVIQKNSGATSCLHYDFWKNSYGEHHLTEWKPHSELTATIMYHEHRTDGKISTPDPYQPGRLAVDFPSNGSPTKVTVLMTNYDHYAVIIECKDLSSGHQWQISVLSRSRTMSQWQLDDIRRRLPGYNIDPFTLAYVSQQNCAQPVRQDSTNGEVVVGVVNSI